ncbi:MAG: hypothetical protein CVU89_05655 [Firmicutes bacterium HGW-Firmicutes-14]|jgi:tetratricopeptide (TPR) repeat protein|nr:MAG: hypothetical protein CVU89_05655 [Firmicutes bacterium HGW-Firmicutes-14]
MAFMNARKRNKTMTYIIVALVSLGLLITTLPSIGSYLFSGTGSGGSSAYSANNDFESAMNLLGQGKVKDANRKFESAIDKYEKILKETPDDILVLGDLATAKHYTGNTDEAITLVKKALEINPAFSTARINYAIYLFEGKGDVDSAIAELGKIEESDPNYQRAQTVLANIENAAKAPPQTSPAPGGPVPPPPGGQTPPPPAGN